MGNKGNEKQGRANRYGLTEEDFYLTEQGFMVFTSAYHLKRGYCCKSGCLHCPYGYRKSDESAEMD